jgi:LysM repeat protein
LIKKYYRETSKEKMLIYEVISGDTLGKISDKFKINWKKLAIINEIKQPFEVRVGDKLFIPKTRKNKILLEDMKKQSVLTISISERSGYKKGKKKIIFIILLIIIGVGVVLGNRWRNKKIISERKDIPEVQQPEEKKETADMTKSGVFKKSGLKVAIANYAGDAESNRRLLKKLELIGYLVSYDNREGDYKKTVIEYLPGKEDKVKILRADIGAKDENEIELREKTDLSFDAVVYNFISKDDFLDFSLENPNQNQESASEGE